MHAARTTSPSRNSRNSRSNTDSTNKTRIAFSLSIVRPSVAGGVQDWRIGGLQVPNRRPAPLAPTARGHRPQATAQQPDPVPSSLATPAPSPAQQKREGRDQRHNHHRPTNRPTDRARRSSSIHTRFFSIHHLRSPPIASLVSPPPFAPSRLSFSRRFLPSRKGRFCVTLDSRPRDHRRQEPRHSRRRNPPFHSPKSALLLRLRIPQPSPDSLGLCLVDEVALDAFVFSPSYNTALVTRSTSD
ncbi:hypothetical protein G7Z17_g7567 [Cylindrodendrum hubeiense]|uniref:Uncharacterized protein n=1 Tax=Cylindrodendrum hubeiense TaxID=595255 RepID=A0A9P5LFM6_9HYPO|nr:hypothetical protein G7Z17_g7567 [Cylindrodendrum hubeiense]